jgi:hypothetical protein
MKNFGDRVRYWQGASDEKWEEGLQGMLLADFGLRVLIDRHAELKQRFSNTLQKVFYTRLGILTVDLT